MIDQGRRSCMRVLTTQSSRNIPRYKTSPHWYVYCELYNNDVVNSTGNPLFRAHSFKWYVSLKSFSHSNFYNDALTLAILYKYPGLHERLRHRRVKSGKTIGST
ncbi:hypothetical protein PoB_000812200 [Plakobranchus ocellatus]|uniref:MATH domain-containing protein n=1 Tax=Plakobranchus ocellatus TaxID=259542 RepID=A0AAV3YFH9_9GAST|nr:hypothetical protein PoB_000812200 [Plakobranchus ocellatus]